MLLLRMQGSATAEQNPPSALLCPPDSKAAAGSRSQGPFCNPQQARSGFASEGKVGSQLCPPLVPAGASPCTRWSRDIQYRMPRAPSCKWDSWDSSRTLFLLNLNSRTDRAALRRACFTASARLSAPGTTSASCRPRFRLPDGSVSAPAACLCFFGNILRSVPPGGHRVRSRAQAQPRLPASCEGHGGGRHLRTEKRSPIVRHPQNEALEQGCGSVLTRVRAEEAGDGHPEPRYTFQ